MKKEEREPALAQLVRSCSDGRSVDDMCERAHRQGHTISPTELADYAADNVPKIPSKRRMAALAAALDVDVEEVRLAVFAQYVRPAPWARPDASRVHEPRRRARTRLRALFTLSDRTVDGWTELTDGMQPPDGTLQAFAQLHPEVRADRVPLVWEAFLQWVRIWGRCLVANSWRDSPSDAPMCQPSLAVDRLWQQLAADESVWRELPAQVRGMPRLPVRDHRSRTNLPETHGKAHRDELGGRLPFLFLVDEALRIADGRLYRADCLDEFCQEKSALGHDAEPGRTCLHGTPWIIPQGSPISLS